MPTHQAVIEQLIAERDEALAREVVKVYWSVDSPDEFEDWLILARLDYSRLEPEAPCGL